MMKFLMCSTSVSSNNLNNTFPGCRFAPAGAEMFDYANPWVVGILEHLFTQHQVGDLLSF